MNNKSIELWLFWQNTITRQRYHVGTLIHDDDGFKFYYENTSERRKLKEAVKNGYQYHLAFPDLDKVYYSSKLFGPFARRIPDPRRPDYQVVLQNLGLTPNSSDMDILLASGGILATDDYEFVAPIQMDETNFYFDFHVAGWRHYVEESTVRQLTNGQHIRFHLEPENVEDVKAVRIETSQELKLGYIPAFYSAWFFDKIQSGIKYWAEIEAIHLQADPHRKILIHVEGEIQSTLSSLSNNQLNPVAHV